MPNTKARKAPKELPPELKELAELSRGGAGAPALTIEEILRVQQQATAVVAEGVPTLAPPAEVAEAEAAAEAVTAWHTGVKVTALWVNAAQRNAYAAVEGLGWRRITPANDSAFHAVTAMLSHAKQLGRSVNVRVESDNQIHEVYLW